ncbi:hypothetical protein ACET3X_003465 [Alternaria dauci]|uniref:Uncharacterized protein n=1 Tax=Alternaria dauci TaxID=48095 RepID=A0ABR3USH8_9PLEO
MDGSQFPNFGVIELDDSGWTRQEYNVPQSWITTPNNLDWDTGFQDPIVTNNYIYPEVHESWFNPVMPAPLGGFEFSQNDAVLRDTTSYPRTTVPEFSYAESNVFGTGSDDSSTTGQVVGVRPASFAAQQSQQHYGTRNLHVI